MSANSPQPPDLDRVEKGFKAVTSLTNTLTEFLRWVAGMIRKRDVVGLLMLALAVAVLFWGSKLTLGQMVQEPVFYGVWLGLGVLVLVGVGLELRKKPSLKLVARDPSKRKAIKFLSSFEQEDAEIYARLQGYRDLSGILENMVRPEVGLGVLKGSSGCGKSSYLKAGLLAALAKTEAYRGVYVKFSSLDPLTTVREAVGAAFKLPKGEVESLGLLELLQKGIEAAAQDLPQFKALILIFDQFEQFFVYTDDAVRRSAFIRALATWYNDEELKERVKILVSIREDWFARMDEVQEVLDYSLRVGGQTGGNSFYLKNFSAEEATMILAVMAQEDLGIAEDDTERFDRNYMQEVLERELASGADRLISPVDLQIVADAINQQNTAQMRAFNRTALQRLGGIEGLRRSFLEGILEPLGPERSKAAVQVLVALTNLEQQTRAEAQSLVQVQERVKGMMLPQEVERVAGSLQETGLIARVERSGVQGYELAHEGMIGAVIRLGEKVQDGAYRANQLLERRVNEWLGNGKSARYLFNGRELWALEREKRFLVWGSKREQKQRLIARSKQRVGWIFGLLATASLGAMGFWGWWNYTVLGNITQVRWRLAEVSQQGISSKMKAKAAIAFAKDQNFAQASKLASQMETLDEKTPYDIKAIAEAYGRLNQPQKGLLFLEKVLTAAQKIDDSYLAYAIEDIAEAIGKLNQPEKGLLLLEKVLTAAQKIDNSSSKAFAISTIAEAIGKLKPEKGLLLLEKVLTAAQKIDNSSSKAFAISTIAEAIGKLKPEKGLLLLEKVLTAAQKIDDFSSKAFATINIAEAYGNLNQPEKGLLLLEKVLTATQKIDDSSSAYARSTDINNSPSNAKASAMIGIAEVYGKFNQPEKSLLLLKNALTVAQKIDHYSSKPLAIKTIAKAIGKLNQPEKGLLLLEKVLTAAQKIDDSSSKASVMISIAEAYRKLNQPEKGLLLLKEVLTAVQKIDNSSSKASTMINIAEAYGNLNQPEKGLLLLEKVLTAAQKIDNSSSKASAMINIAEAEANLKNWKQALNVAQQCPSKDCEVESLAKILTVYAEQQHPELKEEKEE